MPPADKATQFYQASAHGRLEKMQELLAEGVDVNARGGFNESSTPLIEAASRGQSEAVAMLINANADLELRNKGGNTALIEAAFKGKKAAVEILLSAGPQVNARGKDDATAVFAASHRDNHDIVAVLLAANADPNVNCARDGATALIEAADRGRDKVAEALLQGRADPNARRTKDGSTALMVAAKNGNTGIMSMLVSSNADLNMQSDDGNTAVFTAVSSRQVEAVELLAGTTADLDIVNKKGASALVEAVRTAAVGPRLVSALLAGGADVNLQLKGGRTALMDAVQVKNAEIVRLLVKAGADPNIGAKNGSTALIDAVIKDATDVLKILVDESPVNLDAKNDIGKTALMWAAMRDKAANVELLLKARAKTEIKDNVGRTALFEATSRNSAEITTLLLKAGANVNAQRQDGSTALIDAANSGHKDAAQVLVQFGADLDVLNTSGVTALMQACTKKKIGFVDFLLAAGANPNVTDDDGKTALMWAARARSVPTFERLIAGGADLNAMDKAGNTALGWTVMIKDLEGTKALVEANADVNARNPNNGWTVLTWALHQRSYDAAEYLVSAGADLDIQDEGGATPLIWAANSKDTRAVEMLIRANANVNIARADGMTALDVARQSSSGSDLVGLLGDAEERLLSAADKGDAVKVAEIIAEGGVNLNFVGQDGLTPLTAAARKGHRDVGTTLVQAGADLSVEDKTGATVAKIDPWLVADVVAQSVASKLSRAPTAAEFLEALRRFPASCVFVCGSIGLGDAAVASVRAKLTEMLLGEVAVAERQRSGGHASPDPTRIASRVEANTLQDLVPVDAILREFVDKPLEDLRATGRDEHIATPQWLVDTVVQASFVAFSEVMDREKDIVASMPELIDEFKRYAQAALADDRSIYEAVFVKMLNKHPAEAADIRRRASEARKRTKSFFRNRPTQPRLTADKATLLELKVQAAKSARRFREFIQSSFLPATRDSGVAVTVAPVLKKSGRILQKWWLRREVVSICDVVRALATVPDFKEMLDVHQWLMACTEIEIVDFKDRLNAPTSGGWADLVYLFRFRSAGSATAIGCFRPVDKGHICELQLALEPMVTARSALHGHAAYAVARHKIELLEALGVDVENAGGAEPEAPEGAPAMSLEERLAAAEAEVERLRAENAVLKEINASLREEAEIKDAFVLAMAQDDVNSVLTDFHGV